MASSSKGTEEIQAVEVKNTNENRSTSKLECLTCGLCMGRRRNRKAMTPRLEFKEQPDSTQSTPRPAKREQDGASQPAVTSEPGRAPAERAAISEKSSTTKDESEESRDANSRYFPDLHSSCCCMGKRTQRAF